MHSYFLDRLTPRTFPRTRLLIAAATWSTVGFFLTLKGINLFREGSCGLALTSIVAGTIMGMLKSRFILDRVAGTIVLHIGSKPSRACLGGFFSLRNWVLIVVMIVAGRTLGALPFDTTIKTSIYVMVGTGLVYSSRLLWNAWKRSPIHFA